MHSLISHKNSLRKRIRELKATHCPSILEELSEGAIATLESLPEFQMARTVMAYWALADEVNTHSFIEQWHGSKRILLPVISKGDIEPRLFYGKSSMVAETTHGILEPKGGTIVGMEEIDLVVVPGVAFDSNGNRLGRGKGYYDRLLKETNTLKVGICFGFQIVNNVPAGGDDIRMDYVVSEKGTISIGK